MDIEMLIYLWFICDSNYIISWKYLQHLGMYAASIFVKFYVQ